MSILQKVFLWPWIRTISHLIQSFCKAMKGLRAVLVSLPGVGSMSLPHLRKKAIKLVFSVYHNQPDDLLLAFILQDGDGFSPFWSLPYLSSQMLTGYHPLFTDGNARSQVLSHRYKWLLKNFKAAQLPLHISSQGSTLSFHKQTQKERVNIINKSLQSQAFQHLIIDKPCSVYQRVLYTKEFLGKQSQFHFSKDVHFINSQSS